MKIESERGKMLFEAKWMISKIDMSRARAAVMALVIAASVPMPADAAGPVDRDYVRSLAAPGKTVLVVEYYDGQNAVVARKGYASAGGFQAFSATEFKVDDKTSLHLFGVEPCDGEMVNRTDGFSGRCDDFASEQLAIKLKAAKVLYCRAFLSEQNAGTQDVTCFGYYNYPGALDTVDNIEEQLVSLGALRLSKNAGGTLLRPDLAAAEGIGRGGFGMWADPRVRDQ
jgi:hypothetical protein